MFDLNCWTGWEALLGGGHCFDADVRCQYILETVNNCQQFFAVQASEAWNKQPDSVVGARSIVSFKGLMEPYCRGYYSWQSSNDKFHEVS